MLSARMCLSALLNNLKQFNLQHEIVRRNGELKESHGNGDTELGELGVVRISGLRKVICEGNLILVGDASEEERKELSARTLKALQKERSFEECSNDIHSRSISPCLTIHTVLISQSSCKLL